MRLPGVVSAFGKLAGLALIGLACAQPSVAVARTPARLGVLIVVDQFSADLFAQYRGRFTGGLARLATGGVFPAAFQAHASTFTCPGHASIGTGTRPARSGIIANDWYVPDASGGARWINCMEDAGQPAPAGRYRESLANLHVPTLADLLKDANPANRVVALSGKDRGAMLLGGRQADQIWWRRPDSAGNANAFVSFPGRSEPDAVRAFNLRNGAVALHHPAKAMSCSAGRGRSASRRSSDTPGLGERASEMINGDRALIRLAGNLATELHLGAGAGTDLLAISASGTDAVGHAFGPGGAEMCEHLASLDASLGELFERLDASGVDYVVALSADHGAVDIPERAARWGAQDLQRASTALSSASANEAIAKAVGHVGKFVEGKGAADFWLSATVPAPERAEVLSAAIAYYRAQPEVLTVLDRADIAAAPIPAGPPEEWSIPMRARAAYRSGRSGDFYVILRPRILNVPVPRLGVLVDSHGSPWDYDRRVPMLFWRKGLAGFEQPLSVEAVDLAPTLAAFLGLELPAGTFDGKCLFECPAGRAPAAR